MTQGFLLLSDMLTACIRTAVYLFFVICLLSADAKKADGRFFAVLFSGTALLAVCLFPADIADIYRWLPGVVFASVCTARWLQINTRMCLFLGIYFELAAAFWQFLLAAGLGVVTRSQTFFDRFTAGGQLALWLLHILLAVSALLSARHGGSATVSSCPQDSVSASGRSRDSFPFRRSAGRHVLSYRKFDEISDMTKKGISRIISTLSAAGLLAVVSLSEQTRLAIPDDLLDMWTILSVVLLMGVLVFRLNRQYEAEKELSTLKTDQAALLERDYTALNRAYALNARLFHDFHNHIGALRQLLSQEKYPEAMQYLDGLFAPVREMTDTVWTGDTTVDYLINEKSAGAKAEQIPFDAQVEFPANTNLSGADLCAILGNLLDNAIEAARKVQNPGERFIRLAIRRVNHLLVIRVENSADHAPVQENGTLKTTKTESGLHGWGLKSARAAAEKYDGVLQTSFTDGTFLAVATLSFFPVSAGGAHRPS